MVLRSVAWALSVLLAPVAWAQFGSADMMKLAASRLTAMTEALKLSPEQASAIKPLLESKYTEMGAVKEKALGAAKGDGSKPVADARQAKYEAVESLKRIDSSYDKQIVSHLNPDQAKKYKNLTKTWKSDLSLNVPKPK